MTRIWKETGFVGDDPWIVETDETKAGEGERALLPLAAFIEAAEASNDVGMGVLLGPADDVMALEPYLYRLEIVALTFAAFSDGRGYSQASLLRDRLDYKNELRATGDVLIDQIPLMLRTGIDSFAVRNPVALKRLEEGRLPGIAEHYQPAATSSEAVAGYSWRRRA
ncbi:DUF934 domain-containing protein [Rhizobium halophytocola]|uniref:Uncharacterized protein (DUF934 family) n=1 Tax=Rhizobium halophytocola TaxID=735519 RepID=A0ABS4DWI5_9HYPH|nr:DUF934 domain-containing protein [Rhizobium halophytocola]MBP1850056.1 uncharacterized protein (DUF934 family) [Rhizobium halophytocola]